jgi:signal transduction histidine kinase
VRNQVLGQMERKTLRWRFAWFVPFNVVAFGVLWARGEPGLRAVAQLVSLVVCVSVALYPRKEMRGSAWPFFWHAVHYFIGLSITGALASPLIPMGLPMVASSAVILEHRRSKWIVAGTFLVGFLAMGLVSGFCAWGCLPRPLSRDGMHPSIDFYVVAAVTLTFTVISLVRIGLFVTDAYTQIALELAARREELFEESEDYARSLEGVAARLAHEVKNPLAAIKGLSTHVARSTGDAKTAERLAIVAQEADRLQGIVDGFLGFTRGLDDLRPAPVRPHEVARELLLLLEPRAGEMGVALEVLGDERVEVVADARKLRQALLNVVLNALQASPRGAKVTLAVARGGPETVRIRVVDRGAGMSKQVLERIRKPYFTTRSGGSGLGVAIARALVEQHEGQMLIESEPGKGTTVTIELLIAGPTAVAKLPGVGGPREEESSPPS